MDRTVKIELSRETDMTLVPGRSPFRADYKIVLDRQTGAIEALQIDMIVNGGSAEDYSPSIAETSIFLIDNAYHIANADIRARCGRSNLPAGFTATRGYGKPQTGAIIEKILDDAAAHLDIDPQDLRKTNLYTRGQKALAETPIDDDVLRSCWTSAVDGNYAEWRSDCTSFNAENGMVKRGVAGIPSKGNMGFLEASDINRGSAIVRLHSDGSVRISHSGVEMGQGLNTRMSQVASYALNIPIEKVTIDPTRTSDLPNTPPTTMVATDMIGAAIMNACDELLETLARAGYPESATFSEATRQCYDEGWPMEATGHAQEPRLRFDWEKQQGNVSYFFVWGAALAEAEIDLGTGSWRILRTHITQDCGTSLNPMLDIGQVEGGFALAIAGYFGINPPGFVAQVVAFAFGLAAASFFPAIILGIFDTRTNKEGAISGMVVGLAFTTLYIIGVKFRGMEPWLLGISAEGIGTVGMILNFVVTWSVSRLTPPPPPEIRQMVEDLRLPGEGPPALADVGEEELD